MPSKVSRRLSEGVAAELSQHIYGPRLARDFPAVFAPMSAVNQAHVAMLSARGLLEPEAARALAEGLLRMEREGHGAVALDPEREDSYFNYEAHLIGLIGPDAGGRMHVARSRNDLNATVDRMRARLLVLDLGEALAGVLDALLVGALRHAGVVMPGYTHLQPAQPITYGFYLAGLAEALERDLARLCAAWPRINLSPLGAGALAGTAFPIDRALTADLLGFDGLLGNALDAVASRDFAFEILGTLAGLAVTWSRAAQDFFVMVSHEFGTIDFPDRVTGTSSIMPQKKNPFVLEHLKGRAGHVIALQSSALIAAKGSNFTNTSDANRDAVRPLWEAGEDAGRCLALLKLVVETATPNAALMLRRVHEDFACATDLADALVREADLSFRDAHHVVGAVVKAALDRGLPANGITADMVARAAEEELGRAVTIPADIAACLDPARSVASRTIPGGPAPSALATSVDALRRTVAAHEGWLASRRAGLAEASERLRIAIGSLAVA